MANVNIFIECLAQTRVNKEAVERWLQFLEVSQESIDSILSQNISDAALLVALAAKQCYMSFEEGMNPNVTKVRTNMVAFLDNILASRHGSVLEHCTYTFGIKNVSRVFTGEMNRHRAGVAISEQSMRYIRFEEKIDWWMPNSLIDRPDDSDEMSTRKAHTRRVFHRAFAQMEQNYKELVDIWDMDAADKDFHYKKTMTSCFRRIIGMGVATGGVWTFNIRALRHILAIRTSSEAEEEIAYVGDKVIRYIIKQEPELFGDFIEKQQGVWVPKYEKV